METTKSFCLVCGEKTVNFTECDVKSIGDEDYLVTYFFHVDGKQCKLIEED